MSVMTVECGRCGRDVHRMGIASHRRSCTPWCCICPAPDGPDGWECATCRRWIKPKEEA